jgi:hypothetical protein
MYLTSMSYSKMVGALMVSVRILDGGNNEIIFFNIA